MIGPDALLILVVILLIVLLARGPKVLPEIGTSLGQMIRGFRESVKDPNEGQASPSSATGPSSPTTATSPTMATSPTSPTSPTTATDQAASPSAPGQGGPVMGPGGPSGG